MIRTGKWQTDSGSYVELIIDGNQVSGFYSSVHGKPQPDEKFPITGVANGEFIGFSVLWHPHDSITSWTGRYNSADGKEYIKSNWHLARKYKDNKHQEPTEEWDTFLTNQSVFYKVDA